MGSPRAPVLKVPCRQAEYVTPLYRCLTNCLAANGFLRLLGRYLAISALSLNQLTSQWIRPNSPPPIDYVCSRSQNADLILCQGLDFFKNTTSSVNLSLRASRWKKFKLFSSSHPTHQYRSLAGYSQIPLSLNDFMIYAAPSGWPCR